MSAHKLRAKKEAETDPKRVREVFYIDPMDPENKLLRRKASGRAFAMSVAGSVTKEGYRWVMMDGNHYAAHRLIWVYHYGAWPKWHLDHIDGNPRNNRLENLREVSSIENCRNRKRSETANKSGVVGVCWNTSIRKWQSTIKVQKKTIHLGFHESLLEAAAARKSAERKHGFHRNHGRG